MVRDSNRVQDGYNSLIVLYHASRAPQLCLHVTQLPLAGIYAIQTVVVAFIHTWTFDKGIKYISACKLDYRPQNGSGIYR